MRGVDLHAGEAGLLGQCGAAGEALDQLADLLVAQWPWQREHLGEAAQFQGHGRGRHGRLAEVGLHLPAGVVELHPELRALGAADARPVAEALQQAVVFQHHAAGAGHGATVDHHVAGQQQAGATLGPGLV